MVDELRRLISAIGGLDLSAAAKARARLDNLTKPKDSLGRLEEIAVKIAAITGKGLPAVGKKAIITMAADHGVVDEGVSAYPREVTAQMVLNFLRGGAAINVLGRHVGARVVVVDMGVAGDIPASKGLIVKKVGHGTKNMARSPAMSRAEAVRAIMAGAEVFQETAASGLELAGTGDMGIGNTTASSAIAAVLTGEPVESLTGRGTGIDDSTFSNKVKIIEKAIELNKPDPDDPVDVLAKVGGYEIGGIAGVILAAAKAKVPVVIDGFISGSAALIAAALQPKVKDFIIASHRSVEKGHRAVLKALGVEALFDFDMRLGEGTGAALAMGVIDASLKILNEMATFSEAGVSEKSE